MPCARQGVHADFFESGGNSLLGGRLIAQVALPRVSIAQLYIDIFLASVFFLLVFVSLYRGEFCNFVTIACQSSGFPAVFCPPWDCRPGWHHVSSLTYAIGDPARPGPSTQD